MPLRDELRHYTPLLVITYIDCDAIDIDIVDAIYVDMFTPLRCHTPLSRLLMPLRYIIITIC